MLMISKNYFNLGLNIFFLANCPKNAQRGDQTKFVGFFFHRCTRKKSWKKSRIFINELAEDFLNKGKKPGGLMNLRVELLKTHCPP